MAARRRDLHSNVEFTLLSDVWCCNDNVAFVLVLTWRDLRCYVHCDILLLTSFVHEHRERVTAVDSQKIFLDIARTLRLV